MLRSLGTAGDAARQMVEQDFGSLPVVDDDRKVIGIVTDRDLVARGFASGKGPDTTVADLMSSPVLCCGPSTDTADVANMIATHQVRRVPVVDDDDRVVGIVAQAIWPESQM
jgi:CBS domain-containing protein